MYNLAELGALLERRSDWQEADIERHQAIISMLNIVEKNYAIDVPEIGYNF